MSLVITLYVREGIVMASDSRITLSRSEQETDQQVVKLDVALTDASYKTFLATGNVGISTYGSAELKGVPLAGYIESFIAESLGDGKVGVDDVPRRLLEYFRRLNPIPEASFDVAGYKTVKKAREQHVWRVSPASNTAYRANDPGDQGIVWGGEIDILSRLIHNVAQVDAAGTVQAVLPSFPIPWNFFTLQDAIDFSIFAIRSTIDAMRFQTRAKTVGGPIDVLVLKPYEAFWVQRKELHGERVT